MLTKEQVIHELRKFTLIGDGRIMFKVISHEDNILAPEKVCYRLHYSDVTGERRKVSYWPNTVGFQWG